MGGVRVGSPLWMLSSADCDRLSTEIAVTPPWIPSITPPTIEATVPTFESPSSTDFLATLPSSGSAASVESFAESTSVFTRARL